jgi:glycosyltransferase involved in cell wall biosynthesis
MERAPSPLKDLRSLFDMTRFLMQNRYDVLHISTPKAAFLAAIAGWLTGQRNILFVVRTRIYEDQTGIRKWLFAGVDKVVCLLSKLVAPISREMGADMVRDKLCPANKIRYFGEGSSNGINVERFSKGPRSAENRRAFRAEHGIPAEALVVLFLGRLAKGKGIHHIPDAVRALEGAGHDVRFVIAGPLDWREPADPAAVAFLESHPLVVRVPFQGDPAPAYDASDILLFPSEREGFGNVALEAQAMELPVIGFNVPGVREAVEDGVSGLLAQPGATDDLSQNLLSLVNDADLRRKMGQAAADRVRRRFSHQVVWGDLLTALRDLKNDRVRS